MARSSTPYTRKLAGTVARSAAVVFRRQEGCNGTCREETLTHSPAVGPGCHAPSRNKNHTISSRFKFQRVIRSFFVQPTAAGFSGGQWRGRGVGSLAPLGDGRSPSFPGDSARLGKEVLIRWIRLDLLVCGKGRWSLGAAAIGLGRPILGFPPAVSRFNWCNLPQGIPRSENDATIKILRGRRCPDGTFPTWASHGGPPLPREHKYCLWELLIFAAGPVPVRYRYRERLSLCLCACAACVLHRHHPHKFTTDHGSQRRRQPAPRGHRYGG